MFEWCQMQQVSINWIQFPVSCSVSHCYQSKPIRLWADTDRTVQPEPGGGRNESQQIRIRYHFIMRGKVLKEWECKESFWSSDWEQVVRSVVSDQWEENDECKVWDQVTGSKLLVTCYSFTEIERSVAAQYISNMQLSQCCHEGQWERERWYLTSHVYVHETVSPSPCSDQLPPPAASCSGAVGSRR